MQIGDSSFEQLMQEVLNQQHRLKKLEAENQELRRQLADIRRGRGIVVDIQHKTFALAGGAVAASSERTPAPEYPSLAAQKGSAKAHPPFSSILPDPETPIPSPVDSFLENAEAPSLSPAFLEELLFDEFAAAATSPITSLPLASNTPVPDAAATSEALDEEKKAALRRELMGSFLLE
ncbi:MAG: hypothetical protein H0U76_28905 [Ktedonobacteraceae bacterium]|nr:hypothetical protein [Ktedonobacteraceae bacterium]